ncbi:phage antirepressor N-terminal domain-containing protein, partial [Salmonella enterica subsp. enterica serovar Montevideo]
MGSKNSEAPKAATNEASNLSVTSKELTNMSIAAQITTINVPFHGDTLYLVSYNGEPFTPMKPIVDGMGLDWASQFTKIKNRFKSSVVEITMVA